jgi:hypothetical protein
MEAMELLQAIENLQTSNSSVITEILQAITGIIMIVGVAFFKSWKKQQDAHMQTVEETNQKLTLRAQLRDAENQFLLEYFTIGTALSTLTAKKLIDADSVNGELTEAINAAEGVKMAYEKLLEMRKGDT